ncbi:MAG: DUF2847 family protein [Gemmatimonadota bacterium]|nr:DUF2847 family protein [Gemmatimonadota bacterium]MDQ8167217.1 DUF2847 family protein [Gemmatimonadota bacterium]MDQ8172156.1 DUF2847 family protein [Gemmatimonadota bacterium]
MHPSALTDASFAHDVLAHDGLVVVDVWAEWCTPCRALVPVFRALAAQYEGRARVMTCDADANLETVTRFDVRALPTVLLFQRGVLVERISGAQSLTRYAAAIDAQLRSPGTAAAPAAAPAPAPGRPVRTDAEAEARALLESPEAAVVFKHSHSCPVSFSAKRQVEQFVVAHPGVPVRTVVVQQERALADALETVSRIRHETPQVFVVRDGRVLWDASHGAITLPRLAAAINAATSAPDPR